MAFLKKIPLFFLFLLILNSVYGMTGTCELTDATQHPGQITTFRCSCTSSAEENRPGFIVWRNSSTILQSTPVSSGSCRTNFFGSSYQFEDSANYTGNVTFSLNADGTGTPISWGDVGDVNFALFNVTGAHVVDCSIEDIIIPTSIDLGRVGINTFVVKDAITKNPLVHASCFALAYAADGSPILIEPYGEPESNYVTGANGRGVLKSFFNNQRFETDTTYSFSLFCHCTNETGKNCYDDNTGNPVGFKSCNVNGIFTTGGDFRKQDSLFLIGAILGSLGIILMFCIIGYLNIDHPVGFFGFGFAMIETIILLGLIYGNSVGRNLSLIFKINFIGMLVIGFGIAMVGFLLQGGKASGFVQDNETKWNEKGWNKKWW